MMDLLLDTHALLWFIGGDDSLTPAARQAIEDATNNRHVSIVSIWEIAIKVRTGKMNLTEPFGRLFPYQLEINGFELMPVKVEHTSIITVLPFHHRDPFDRLLIAQAMIENMSIVSGDKAFDDYDINRLW
jgi:PIN domain nuclease of toxin-antitoxin system